MLVMFSFFFFSPRVLRVPSTDRPETLPPDRNLRLFYNASPKIRGGHSPCDSWSVGLFDVSCFMRGCSVFLYTFCVYSRKLVHVQ